MLLADAVCRHAARCCTPEESDYYMGPFVDEADCAQWLVSAAELEEAPAFGNLWYARVGLPNLAALERAIRDGRVRLDREAVLACVAWLDELSCNAPAPLPEVSSACQTTTVVTTPCSARQLVRGRVPEGGACSLGTSSLECREPFECRRARSGLGDDGACTRPQQVDERCTSDEHCAQGLYCSFLDGTCQAPGALGDACLYSVPEPLTPDSSLLLLRCAAGLTCSPLDSTCVARCERGASCTTDDRCGSGTGMVCVELGARSSDSGFCDVPRASGERCTEHADCGATLACWYQLDTDASFCRPRVAVGEACLTDEHCTSHQCRRSSANSQFECQPPRPSGWPCMVDRECASGFCDIYGTGECTERVANGEPCPTRMTLECLDGYCAVDQDTGNATCAARLAAGDPCPIDDSCVSGACVAGTCGTRPVADGALCLAASDCTSGFCNYEGVEQGSVVYRCRSLPLPDGSPCADSGACASRACFEETCQAPAADGDPCGERLRPCDFNDSFCDTDAELPVCTRYLEMGESCARDVECRGDCVQRWGRRMCGVWTAPDAATCDGR